jgi:muramoyltetrapeptide carboxypeptidase
VRVVAPAGPVRQPEAFAAGIALLDQRFGVERDPAVLAVEGYLAGSDDRRLAELQAALDQPGIGAVIAARGGFGSTRIVDRLDLRRLLAEPRWIVGSSDLTGLLVKLWADHRMQAIHGPMVERLAQQPNDAELLFALLEGRRWRPPSGLRTLRPGAATGALIGGNLTMLAHLAGTVDPAITAGTILLLEDVGEAPYRLDRALVQLERAGWLSGAAGLVLGEFTSCAPGPDDVAAEQVLAGLAARLEVPVAAGYPAAHGARNHPFVHGGPVELECGAGGAGLRPVG